MYINYNITISFDQIYFRNFGIFFLIGQTIENELYCFFNLIIKDNNDAGFKYVSILK